MALRKCFTMVFTVAMLVVLLCQNCFAFGGLTASSTINYVETGTLSTPEIAPGQVIVAIELGYESTIINETTLAELGVVSVVNVYGSNSGNIDKFLGHSTWLFKLKDYSVQGVYNAISKLTTYPYVVYAEPNYIVHTT
jgi:hypothetical protein